MSWVLEVIVSHEGFHIFCLDPPLSSIPKGQWFCHVCLFGVGEEFGFDEGEEHSLASFQARDEGFRAMWFRGHEPPKPDEEEWSVTQGKFTVSEDFMERQFWELVQSPIETVEVEYGADVHSTTHGR
jgi:[histone H3]-trimethyl-L-lysine4 demethylase